MANPLVGSPDYQHGVTTAQKLLTYSPNNMSTIQFAVPPNAETIIVVAGNNPGLGSLLAVGLQSGLYYAINQYTQRISGQAYGQYFINVSAQVDTSMSLSWTVAPSTGTWVYSDQASHVSFDPNVGLLTALSANAPGAYGTASLGTDGTNQYEIATTTRGRQIPIVPTSTTGLITVGTTATSVLAAPGSGNNYLFGLDVRNDYAGSNPFELLDGGSVAWAVARVPTGDTVTISLDGLAVNFALSAICGAAGMYIVLRYAAGP